MMCTTLTPRVAHDLWMTTITCTLLYNFPRRPHIFGDSATCAWWHTKPAWEIYAVMDGRTRLAANLHGKRCKSPRM